MERLFLLDGAVVDREEVKRRVMRLRDLGMPLPIIATRIHLSTSSVVSICDEMSRAKSELVQRTEGLNRYGIISEHPFPTDVADDDIMHRLDGPWLHGSTLEDAEISVVKSRIRTMVERYGWIEVVRLVPVDWRTLLDKGWDVH